MSKIMEHGGCLVDEIQGGEEKVFSQSEAVTRCRHVKEAKLKGYFSLAKLADEEVMIHQANLEEIRHNLNTRLKEQRSLAQRQVGEAENIEVSGVRKRQLIGLVDKLSTIKMLLRFQEEQRERELIFKSNMRQKRAAFLIRQAKLEQRQSAERTELMQAQNRLQETVTQVRNIELRSINDATLARRRRKENEILAQQSKMKMQMEFEHLREIQIIKARHLSHFNDVEILNAEEIEELSAQHRQEEFDVLAKQRAEMQAALDELEAQRRQLEAARQSEKQAQQTAIAARNQKKLDKVVFKQHRQAMRNRERTVLLENPVIVGEFEDNDEFGGFDDESSMAASSAAGSSNCDISVSDVSSMVGDREPQASAAANDRQVSDEDDDEAAEDAASQARINSERNKINSGMENIAADEEKELAALNANGQERIRNLAVHHKKILTDLRNQHKSAINLKNKEHRRRISDLIKEQEEEIENLKTDQAASMNELIRSQEQSDEDRKDTDISQRFLGMKLPAFVIEEMGAGRTSEPQEFQNVTVLYTDIFQFKEFASRVANPSAVMNMLTAVSSAFDEILMKYEDLYRVDAVSDSFLIVSGLVKNSTGTDASLATRFAVSAARCATELLETFEAMNWEQFGITDEIPMMRVGMHSGSVVAGIVGNKICRYRIVGEPVQAATQMCATADAGTIQVSSVMRDLVDGNTSFECEERGQMELKGLGNVTTFLVYGHNRHPHSTRSSSGPKAVKFS